MDFPVFDDLSRGLRGLVAGAEGGMDYIVAGFVISIAILIILNRNPVTRFCRSITSHGKAKPASNNEKQITGSLLELHMHGADLSQKMDELNFVFLDMSTNPIITPAIKEIENRYSAWEEMAESFLANKYPSDSGMFKKFRAQIHVRKRRLEAQLQLLTGILNRKEVAGNTGSAGQR